MTLKDFFNDHQKVAIAFSGGVDSAYLLYEAKKWADSLGVYFVKSRFQPEFELEDAQKLAEELGVKMKVLELDVLADERVAKNPVDRCYYCKNNIFGTLIAAAKADGFETIIDGTNASDRADDRPGMKALAELGVLSPLRLCGLTKAEIRKASAEAGLFTWDKPAYACLATRVPTGTEITKEILEKIESAEEVLFELGFSDFRVRYFHGAAKVQVHSGDFLKAFKKSDEIVAGLKPYFSEVLLDLEVR